MESTRLLYLFDGKRSSTRPLYLCTLSLFLYVKSLGRQEKHDRKYCSDYY